MADKQFCVYEHVFPNGKLYVGISSDKGKRWRNDGSGYKTQAKVWRAIQKYGWENVDHVIVADSVSKDVAEEIEKFLIAKLDTIKHGYNTAVGGEGIKCTFLSSYMLAMIRAAKYCGINWRIVRMANEERFDQEACAFWNMAELAVKQKHGAFSTTDEYDVSMFWWHVSQYEELWQMTMRGEDTTNWVEKERCEAMEEIMFGTKGKTP